MSARIDNCIPLPTLELMKLSVPISFDCLDLSPNRAIAAIEECNVMASGQRSCSQMPSEKACTADD
jgi:hypothetical protein